MRSLICLLFLFSVVACSDDNDATTVKMRINHYVQPHINQEGYSYNYFVQEGNSIGGKEWTYNYDHIDGFEYEMGNVYDILVAREKVKNPPVDGSSIKTSLIRIVASQKVFPQTTFEIRLSRAHSNGFERMIHGDLSSGFSLFHPSSAFPKSQIDCGDQCDALSQGLANEQSLVGIFTHTDDGVRLVELKNE